MTPAATRPASPLEKVLSGETGAYALLYRRERGGPASVEVIMGAVRAMGSIRELDDLVAGAGATNAARSEPAGGNTTGSRGSATVLLVSPYRQIAERGFVPIDDGADLLAMTVEAYESVPLAEAITRLPRTAVSLRQAEFDASDTDYAATVARVVRDEIGTGEGANFVIKRSLNGYLAEYSHDTALSIFRNLLRCEAGSYWTFLIHTGETTLVGASPERHVTLDRDQVTMTPISGTYRFPITGPTRDGLISFLADAKEEDELFMVVDEELKMMTDICTSGVRVRGPYLIAMANLAHSGYHLEGATTLGVAEVLLRSMFAPTVTGSPLENAARTIAKYEPNGRSYYSGFAALVHGEGRWVTMDSTILIRTAEIDAAGNVRIGVGATLVRESDPAAEAAETAAKAAALARAMGVGVGTNPRSAAADNASMDATFKDDAVVDDILRRRNQRVSPFWSTGRCGVGSAELSLVAGRRALVVDNEDTFTSMISYQLRALGMVVRVRRGDRNDLPEDDEILIMGPGPGNPCDLLDDRIVRSRGLMTRALDLRIPLVAVCLSHQILCDLFGCKIEVLDYPNQGLQRHIGFFGRSETVGFYNTFTALCDDDEFCCNTGAVSVSRDQQTGQIFGLRGRRFASLQFHAESILTIDGPRILCEAIEAAIKP
jgi:phenazine biosynthesis protein phzE